MINWKLKTLISREPTIHGASPLMVKEHYLERGYINGQADANEELKAKLALAIEALEFYDGAHRQHWAIDLNKLSTVAFETLAKIKGEK